MTLVSIIIPFKNPGQFFAPCLKSIQLQTHKELEILMVYLHLIYLTTKIHLLVQLILELIDQWKP